MIDHRIILHSKSTFSGEIQTADPMHPNAVTSGCDKVVALDCDTNLENQYFLME